VLRRLVFEPAPPLGPLDYPDQAGAGRRALCRGRPDGHRRGGLNPVNGLSERTGPAISSSEKSTGAGHDIGTEAGGGGHLPDGLHALRGRRATNTITWTL